MQIPRPVLYALAFVLCAGTVLGAYLWYRTTYTLHTNDARIDGTLVTIASRLSDRVVEVLVHEGDSVCKGQTLIRIDPRSIEAKKARAEANLALVTARYDEIRTGFRPQEILETQARYELARANLDKASRDHQRMEQLARNDGGVTQADRDAAKSAFNAMQASVAAAAAELDLRHEGSRTEAIRAAKAQVQLAQAELDDIQVLHTESTVVSPTNGTVAQKLVSEGELINAGQKLFTIVNTDDIWLNARIEETRIGQVRLEQEVQFTIDGYPGQTFTGKIYEINPATSAVFSLISTENVSGYFTKVMQRVPVKISLPTPQANSEQNIVFRPGMQGTIIITLISAQ
ncbi:MAG: HlyD family secretion protein [Desulfovibrionaceae bacterium]